METILVFSVAWVAPSLQKKGRLKKAPCAASTRVSPSRDILVATLRSSIENLIDFRNILPRLSNNMDEMTQAAPFLELDLASSEGKQGVVAASPHVGPRFQGCTSLTN